MLLFAVQKPLFMLYNYPLAREAAFGEWLAVIWHGLSLDMTVAGYLTIIPALICILSIWWSGGFWRKILKVYIIVVSVVVAAVFAVDMALYPYWGFRVDASIWFYLASPREAMASVTFWETARQILIGIAYGIGFNYFLGKLILPLFDR